MGSRYHGDIQTKGQLVCIKYMPNVKCDVYFLFCAMTKLMGNFILKNINVVTLEGIYIVYTMQLFFGELVTIAFVDILKVGAMDKSIW